MRPGQDPVDKLNRWPKQQIAQTVPRSTFHVLELEPVPKHECNLVRLGRPYTSAAPTNTDTTITKSKPFASSGLDNPMPISYHRRCSSRYFFFFRYPFFCGSYCMRGVARLRILARTDKGSLSRTNIGAGKTRSNGVISQGPSLTQTRQVVGIVWTLVNANCSDFLFRCLGNEIS